MADEIKLPPKKTLRIGVDFGGVLAVSGENYENGQGDVPEMNMPGAVESLKRLKRQGHFLVLVSFCGRSRAQATRKQVPLDEFFDEVYFVKDRKHKNLICRARALDVLIDDRQDVLDTLESAQPILFGGVKTENWDEVCDHLAWKTKMLQLVPDKSIDIAKLVY